jgi:hypothetical protein
VAAAASSVFGDGRLAFTQALFTTETALNLVNSQTLPTSPIYSVGFSKSTLTIVAGSNAATLDVNGTLTTPTGLPGSSAPITHVRTLTFCDNTDDYEESFAKHVVAWRMATGVATIYYSKDYGVSFKSLDISTKLSASGGSSVSTGFIRDVSLQQSFKTYAILVRDDTGIDKILLFDPIKGVLSDGQKFLTIDTSLPLLDAGVKVIDWFTTIKAKSHLSLTVSNSPDFASIPRVDGSWRWRSFNWRRFTIY